MAIYKPGRETSEETTLSWTPSLPNYEKINLCSLSYPVVAFCFESPSKFNTDYMFYIDKICNVKYQTKLIYSFRIQDSGYFLGKETVVTWKRPKKGSWTT